jgi:predicted transposase YbfD/YdcC
MFMQSIPSYFKDVQDFRVINRCAHDLGDILGLVLVGIQADCDDFSEISDYGKHNIDFLRRELGFSFINGVPSEDTIERVLKRLNTKELATAYKAFLGDISLAGKHISIDGKELRSTIATGSKHALVRMVNVWVHEDGLSFGQYEVDKKSNEITAVPALLESIDCKGAVVTIDAMGCQKAIASKIRERGGDYVLAVKKNQGGLYAQIEQEMRLESAHLSSYTQESKQHGRYEMRKITISHQLKWIEDAMLWKDLKSVIMVERTRRVAGVETTSKVFYISSFADVSQENMLGYIRNHWGIENHLHWQLDVTFGEDSAKLRNETAMVNLHQIRKWALLMLKRLPQKMSIKRKRKMIARDNSILIQLLELN